MSAGDNSKSMQWADTMDYNVKDPVLALQDYPESCELADIFNTEGLS